MITDVAIRSTVEEMVRVYDDAERTILSAFHLVDESLKRLSGVFYGGEDRSMSLDSPRSNESIRFHEPEAYLKELRRSCWRIVIAKTKIRMVMSIKAWEAFEKKIEYDEPPPLTVENVHGMLAGFQSQSEAFLREAVREVFEWLRPHHSKHKTNTEFEIGERVIITYCVEKWISKWHLNHHRRQNFIALENVLRLMEGKPRLDVNTYYSDLETVLHTIQDNQEPKGETEYIEFRAFRNGNIHLRFKRMDLIERLNAIAGGANLKPVEK